MEFGICLEEAKKIERLSMTRNTNTGTIDVRLIFDQVNE